VALRTDDGKSGGGGVRIRENDTVKATLWRVVGGGGRDLRVAMVVVIMNTVFVEEFGEVWSGGNDATGGVSRVARCPVATRRERRARESVAVRDLRRD